jgi:hypothetical protein
MTIVNNPGQDPYAILKLKDNSNRPTSNVTVRITVSAPNVPTAPPEHVDVTLIAQETKTP